MREVEKETAQFDLKVQEFFKGKISRPSEIERKTNERLEIQEKVKHFLTQSSLVSIVKRTLPSAGFCHLSSTQCVVRDEHRKQLHLLVFLLLSKRVFQ